jgi:hypothetical protein
VIATDRTIAEEEHHAIGALLELGVQNTTMIDLFPFWGIRYFVLYLIWRS